MDFMGPWEPLDQPFGVNELNYDPNTYDIEYNCNNHGLYLVTTSD